MKITKELPLIKAVSAVLLVLSLGACWQDDQPLAEGKKDFVDESMEELSEYMTISPDEDSELLDSLVNDLVKVLLDQPGNRGVENWYSYKSYWRKKYGAEENIQLYAGLAYEKFLRANDISKAARIKLAQGRIYYLQGTLDRAISHTQQAFELALSSKDSITMGWAMNHLSAVAGQANNLDSAKDYSERGMKIAKLLGNEVLMACLESNYAILVYKNGDVDSAMLITQNTIEVFRKKKLYEFEALATSNLSFMLVNAGRSEEALVKLEEVLGKDDEVSVPTALLLLTTAEAYLATGKYAEAYDYIVRGCEMSEELDLGVGIASCKLSTSTYYEQKGDAGKALEVFKDYHRFNQVQTSEAVKRNMAVQDADRKVRDRDREIESLQIAEREQQQAYRNKLATIIVSAIGTAIVVCIAFLLYRSREHNKLLDQRRIAAEAKLNVLQSQMNPHFIYNALSGIQNYILRSEKIEAFNYLSKFAGLLRTITKSSTEIFIELEREVELLRTYLDLEKLRFREAFNYELDVDDSLLHENFHVPSMMIQPVVENAIIHGLSGVESGGKLWLMMRKVDTGMLCVVKDNGRGRVAALEIARRNEHAHLSIASINSDQRIESLRSLGYTNAKVEIEDLYTNGSPGGTRVSIFLPFKK